MDHVPTGGMKGNSVTTSDDSHCKNKIRCTAAMVTIPEISVVAMVHHVVYDEHYSDTI